AIVGKIVEEDLERLRSDQVDRYGVGAESVADQQGELFLVLFLGTLFKLETCIAENQIQLHAPVAGVLDVGKVVARVEGDSLDERINLEEGQSLSGLAVG